MNWIEQILTALMKFFAGQLKTDKTSEDAQKQPDLKRDLLARIDDHERLR
jgi:hypothetical protein